MQGKKTKEAFISLRGGVHYCPFRKKRSARVASEEEVRKETAARFLKKVRLEDQSELRKKTKKKKGRT